MGQRIVAAMVIALLSTAAAAQGGAVVISRQSSLHASGQITGDQFDLNDTFTTLGLYDNSIGDTLTPESGGATSAQASQRSDISAGTFTGSATGSAAAQVAELDAIAAAANSNFTLVFDITEQAETLVLGGRVASTFDAASRVSVTNEFDAGQTLFSRIVDIGDQDDVTFSQSVLLQPGRYRLLAEGAVTGTPSPNSAEYDVAFRINAGPATPIPLPIGAWSGAMALVSAVVAARVSRR